MKIEKGDYVLYYDNLWEVLDVKDWSDCYTDSFYEDHYTHMSKVTLFNGELKDKEIIEFKKSEGFPFDTVEHLNWKLETIKKDKDILLKKLKDIEDNEDKLLVKLHRFDLINK